MTKLQKLLGKELLFFNGAMGTELQARGLQGGEFPETWNILHPEIVCSIFDEYIKSGANLLKTNTFGANALKFDGTKYSVKEIVQSGVQRCLEAKGNRDDVFVCLDIGPLGKLLQPYGDLPFEKAVELFAEQVRAGAKDCDAVLIETMSDTYEIKAAVLAAKENCDLPVFVTMTFDETGRLLNGADIGTATRIVEALGADAVGFNCGLGPRQVAELLPEMKACTSLPIIVAPNAGIPVEKNGKTCFEVGPEEFAGLMKDIVDHGVAVAGGCCGTGPAHISAMIKSCGRRSLKSFDVHKETFCTSSRKTVIFDDNPKIIGERINPTGKKILQEALKNRDLDYICRMGMQQADAGAHILDVNTGTPGVEEEKLLPELVKSLQGILDLPLQIDTSDVEAMEKSLRIYNGVPLLNSVNGSKESLERVLPLVKKYGATVVALTLDEKGIPSDVSGRIAIAQRIAKKAEEYGIAQNRLIVDPLALTICTGADNAKIVLATLRELKACEFKTLLGVSNISFGLPARDAVNASFYTMALQSGLDVGIINPLSRPMMDAYYGYRGLMGLDVNFTDYIKVFENTGKTEAVKQKDLTLYDAIIKGMAGDAARLVDDELKLHKPMEIIDGSLIPALNYVGDGFEKKTVFLPQLLMSADAAKAAFEKIKKAVGSVDGNGPCVVLATVQGDIHDIGKNIVKALMENYGFKVMDLGKDVPPETIVKAAMEYKAKLVGLSALMTTTVPAMEKTIKALRNSGNMVKILVGGAVLTKEYSAKIGADGYAANAVEAVNFAKSQKS